jgi:hypothetical protein
MGEDGFALFDIVLTEVAGIRHKLTTEPRPSGRLQRFSAAGVKCLLVIALLFDVILNNGNGVNITDGCAL